MKPYAYLSMKFIEDEDFVLMERIEGSWLPNKKQASLNAYGFKNERLSIYLPGLIQTGRYPNLTIKNIFYTDGADFNPIKVDSGFLEITQMDSIQIGGTFRVTLEDEYNGIDHRTVIGNFIIYTR
ncbi:hypothetical protein [Emticicia sp. C21]|uniref:hypothetical protein n=1 Tax=Emticicia sp. C21 TaxID=2302915 RepID=UPI000E357824|nr:hypothetical protein [Emticicia sp. C21]